MAFETGALVRAEFTGTVITAGGSRDGTSKVRGPDGRIHLLTLSNQAGRRAVLAGDFAFTRQPRSGATVQVRLTGKVAGPPDTLLSGAQPVRADGYYYTQYLNPGSDYVQLADAPGSAAAAVRVPDGTKLDVSFTGTVLSRETGLYSTSPVRETGTGREHLLFLDDPTAREQLTGTAAVLPAGATAAARAELAKRTSFRGDEVRDEINALTAGLLTWAARRVRNAAVLQQDFADKAAAEKWIEDSDYDPRRVEAVQVETGDPPPELAALRELDDLGMSITGDWGGGDEVVRGDQFTAAYAQDRFRQDLEDDYGVSSMALGYWPLNLIDWAAAAEALRKVSESFEWAGQTWYSKD